MTHPIKWIRFKRLMEKWALGKLEIDQIIDSGLLPVYYDYNYDPKYFSELLNPFPVPSLDFADYDPEKLFFKRTDIEHFEKKYRQFLPSSASLYSNNDKEIEKQEIPSADIQNEKKVFPCHPGTKWDDIKITLIPDDIVRVKTPIGEGRFSYHEIGLSDGRNKKPKQSWITLKLFAIYNGRLDSEIEDSVKRTLWNTYEINYNKDLPDLTKRLNAHMKKLFDIKDSIFKYHYRKFKAYITKFEIGNEIEKIVPTDSQEPKNIEIDTEKSAFDEEYENLKDKLNFPEKSYYPDQFREDG